MLSKVSLIFGTIVHLRWKQIYFQLFYKLRGKLKRPQFFANLKGYEELSEVLNFTDHEFLPASTAINMVVDQSVDLTFLNSSHEFSLSNIPWNFNNKGKLWNYNLNYFDFLFASNLEQSAGLELVSQYCLAWDSLNEGLEPYPISLRGINWIKFLSKTSTVDSEINKCLFKQYKILYANLEYHILANHLLENAFSLLFASYYFKNEDFYQKASSLLIEELEEQILEDGAHYERSPMYHQIILFRLLDAINLVTNNPWKSQELLNVLRGKALLMISWLEEMTMPDKEIPMVKDATPGIAPDTSQLTSYARKLGLSWSKTIQLTKSGYRKFSSRGLSMIVDVGQVAPEYQPAHAHADELNFLLYASGKPIIVDTGISTYEKNQRRQIERSTMSHNCIFVNQQNSSEVWGGFRVAKRAKVDLIEDKSNLLMARHSGYAHLGVSITRRVEGLKGGFLLEDLIESKSNEGNQFGLNLHFHPDVKLSLNENEIVANDVRLTLSGVDKVTKESYMFACGFNKVMEGQRINLVPSSKTRILISHVD